MDSKYPECDKLATLRKERSVVTDFLEWLRSDGKWVCDQWGTFGNSFDPIHESDDSLVMRFLGVDPAKLEEERRALLEELRR